MGLKAHSTSRPPGGVTGDRHEAADRARRIGSSNFGLGSETQSLEAGFEGGWIPEMTSARFEIYPSKISCR
ncbi:unnamed protein product [Arabis nemorensis]|uniref:Uncharacterized protein n=1 Tax=Arabis nemorensis TaxID=586526 RepID=A0A565BYD4_9BRAS|nr:unnamed protein product [Arabis nemorensis]